MVNVIMLSGVSGAGKTSVVRVFEEKGYRIIENIPNGALNATLEEFKAHPENYAKTVLIFDIRHIAHAVSIARSTEGISPYVMLLDCREAELISRYRLTRHIHPLQAKGLSLEEAMEVDAKDMKNARSLADLYIDTTGLSAIDLRSIVFAHIDGQENNRLVVVFSSFGYKYGLPMDADVVFDCRNIPNPFWIVELRPFTGLDKPIIDYLEKQPESERMFEHMKDYLEYFIETAEKNGRHYLYIDCGCSGGQHRSVYFAQRLYEYFKDRYSCSVNHRELRRYVKK